MLIHPKNPKIPAIIALILLLAGISVYFINSSPGTPDPPRYLPDNKVIEVTDGDTIQLADGTIIRLLGINAPEQGQSCYEEAKNRLESLLLSYEVRLESDPAAPDTDTYGRKLRYVYGKGILTPDVETGLPFSSQQANHILLKEGLARTYFLNQSLKYAEEFQAAEQKAMDNRIGCLWQ